MVIFSPSTRISALFASSFVTLGVHVPFFPVLLAQRGLSDGEIAAVMAVPLVLRVATVSVLGVIADRAGNRGRVLSAYAFLALLGCLLLGPATGFWPILAATAAMALFWNGMLPVTDSLATSVARRGEGVYGTMRAWGSIAYIAANLAAGYLVGGGNGAVVYSLLLFGFTLQFAFTAFAPREPVERAAPDGSARPSMWAGLGELLADRRLITILIGSAVVQSSHAMLYGFGSLWWRSIGFTGGDIGWLWAVSVVGEVALFAKAGWAIERIGARGLLFVGGFGAVARWCLFPFVGDTAVAWTALQLVHAASFAAIHLGTIHVITRSVRDQRAATAQGLMVAFTGLAMALSTLASGALYARFGGTAFLGMAAVAMLGTAILVAVLGLRRDVV